MSVNKDKSKISICDRCPSRHASALTAAAEICPIEFQNQQAVPIESLAFSPIDGRPLPVSEFMHPDPDSILSNYVEKNEKRILLVKPFNNILG